MKKKKGMGIILNFNTIMGFFWVMIGAGSLFCGASAFSEGDYPEAFLWFFIMCIEFLLYFLYISQLSRKAAIHDADEAVGLNRLALRYERLEDDLYEDNDTVAHGTEVRR